MEFTGNLVATHLFLDLVAEDGTPGQAVVHLERSGHLGVSSPAWANPDEVAALAARLAGGHADHIASVSLPENFVPAGMRAFNVTAHAEGSAS